MTLKDVVTKNMTSESQKNTEDKNMKSYIRQLFAEAEAEAAGKEQEGKAAEAEEKKYTDADLDKIINSKFARWQKEQEKKISEAERLAKLSEADRAKAERDALQAELDELKRQNNLAAMHTEARKLLAADKITVGDDLVDMLVSEDADKTKAAVTALSKAFSKAVQDAVKEALRGKAPSKGSGAGTMTKADILAIQDPVERQQAIRDNISLFKDYMR